MRSLKRKILWIALILCTIYAKAFVNVSENAVDYLNKNLRLYAELTPLQKSWMSLEESVFNIKSVTDPVDWKALNDKAVSLLDEELNLYTHVGEDISKINKTLKESELKKIRPFLTQLFIYADALNRTIVKLCKIVNRLYKLSLDPEEWTARDYLVEIEKYKALVEEYHEEGKKMNDEQDKLKNISIESK